MGYQACDICAKNITNDEQYYLCEECWDKEKHKVKPQPDELGKVWAFSELEDRIRKLEKDAGLLDEVFNECNLRDLKVHSDFERRIKALEAVVTHAVPYATETGTYFPNSNPITDNAEQTKNILTIREMTPQEKNPLTKNEIIHLVDGGVTGESLEAGACHLCKSIKAKLESYLEK